MDLTTEETQRQGDDGVGKKSNEPSFKMEKETTSQGVEMTSPLRSSRSNQSRRYHDLI